MLQKNTLLFLKSLKKNNNKIWFDKNRKQYEYAKADFQQLVSNIIPAIAKFDASINNLSPKDCIFRINRDIRFSKDKSPYKTNMGAYFNKGGKKINTAGYYLHIEPGKSFTAGGLWMPESSLLNKVRQEIDYNFNEWKKIINTSSFKKTFPAGIGKNDLLSRPPKGYEENNPAIEYLKMKSFIVSRPINDISIESKSFINEVVKIFKEMNPLINFLNRAVE